MAIPGDKVSLTENPWGRQLGHLGNWTSGLIHSVAGGLGTAGTQPAHVAGALLNKVAPGNQLSAGIDAFARSFHDQTKGGLVDAWAGLSNQDPDAVAAEWSKGMPARTGNADLDRARSRPWRGGVATRELKLDQLRQMSPRDSILGLNGSQAAGLSNFLDGVGDNAFQTAVATRFIPGASQLPAKLPGVGRMLPANPLANSMAGRRAMELPGYLTGFESPVWPMVGNFVGNSREAGGSNPSLGDAAADFIGREFNATDAYRYGADPETAIPKIAPGSSAQRYPELPMPQLSGPLKASAAVRLLREGRRILSHDLVKRANPLAPPAMPMKPPTPAVPAQPAQPAQMSFPASAPKPAPELMAQAPKPQPMPPRAAAPPMPTAFPPTNPGSPPVQPAKPQPMQVQPQPQQAPPQAPPPQPAMPAPQQPSPQAMPGQPQPGAQPEPQVIAQTFQDGIAARVAQRTGGQASPEMINQEMGSLAAKAGGGAWDEADLADAMQNAGGNPQDPNFLQQFLDYFTKLDGWQQLALVIGVPVALGGLASAAFGNGGMGAALLGGAGLAAAGVGAMDPFGWAGGPDPGVAATGATQPNAGPPAADGEDPGWMDWFNQNVSQPWQQARAAGALPEDNPLRQRAQQEMSQHPLGKILQYIPGMP